MWQSRMDIPRDTGNIGYTRHKTKINKTKNTTQYVLDTTINETHTQKTNKQTKTKTKNTQKNTQQHIYWTPGLKFLNERQRHSFENKFRRFNNYGY